MIGKMVGKGAASSFVKSLSQIATHPLQAGRGAVGVYKSGVSKIGTIMGGETITRQGMSQIGKESAKMLGTTAALTYAYRGVRAVAGGPGMFKNRKGKRDLIPFMPVI